MGNENTGRKIPKTVGHRKKLSDISNTPILLKSRIHDENAQLVQKATLDQLQEELANLKKTLKDKEEVLAESKRCMEKLWCNYCRKSKQNNEIILHNSQLYRDLTQAQDQFKVLQHENIQMSAVYKACKLEMQEKPNEALEQVDRLRKLVEASSHKQACDKQYPASAVSGRSLCDIPAENSARVHSDSTLRKRQRKSYKEPSLKVKLRQTDGGTMNQNECNQSDNILEISEPAESKGMEVATIVAVSAFCTSELTGAVENVSHLKASQQCTPKILPTSTHGLWDRPRRRAASSMGSFKEPPLNTKMRRAD